MKFTIDYDHTFYIEASDRRDALIRLRDYFDALSRKPYVQYGKLRVVPVEPMLAQQEDDG